MWAVLRCSHSFSGYSLPTYEVRRGHVIALAVESDVSVPGGSLKSQSAAVPPSPILFMEASVEAALAPAWVPE